MSYLKTLAAGAALAASCLAPDAGAASTFVPAAPLPFELVNLRLTVDSCAFNPSTVVVVNTSTSIQVRMQDNQCLVAGTPREVDIRLGAFPIGQYNVDVLSLNSDIITPRERLSFTVIPRAVITVFPPPPYPLTDYTGLWWNPAQPGWGLSIYQSPMDVVFGALFDYADGSNGTPTWITVQSGQWASSTVWVGRTIRTTGNPLTVQDLGDARLEFDVPPPDGAPAGRKWGRLTYRLQDGGVATKFITRNPL